MTTAITKEDKGNISMTDLGHYISAIDESANSLKTLYFRPAGVFTNALVLRPDITSLLRDADSHENALYQVDHQGKPERKDGTRGVVDRLNDEFDELELQQQLEVSNGGVHPLLVGGVERPSAVLVPREVEQEEVPDHNKGVKNLLNRFNEENENGYDVDVLCETVLQLLKKYPIDGVEKEVQRYKRKWSELNGEILEHEDTLERQRRQLSMLNVSLNDRGLQQQQHQRQPVEKKSRSTVSLSAKEAIAEEEAQIRRLEAELEARQRD